MAMDFSGQRSRVIENPSEALCVAVEEGLSWRVSSHVLEKSSKGFSRATRLKCGSCPLQKKSCHRLSTHGSPCTSQSLTSSIGRKDICSFHVHQGDVRHPERTDTLCSPGLHVSQSWFHGKMSREDAQRLITQQGLIDG